MSVVRSCAQCGKPNRVPPRHLAAHGRCGACQAPLEPLAEPIEVDASQFDAITREASVPVLVDFWAPWCGPCRSAAPEVKKAAEHLAGQAVVLKVNTDSHPELAQRYGIRGIPNFSVFVGGERRWDRSGVMRHVELEHAVKAAAPAA